MSDTVELPVERAKILENSAKLLNQLWNDPKEGINVKKAWKNVFPDAVIPEVEIDREKNRIEQELATKAEETNKMLQDKLSAFEKKLQERDEAERSAKEAQQFEQEIDSVRRKYALTEEGMQKVYARMKEKNNPDVEAAAAWVTDHEVKAKPTSNSSFAPQEMNLYGSSNADKEWETLNKNPIKYFDNTVTEMINDFNNGSFGKYKEFGGNL
jgi:Skp family chaperone for outer membrane proteins